METNASAVVSWVCWWDHRSDFVPRSSDRNIIMLTHHTMRTFGSTKPKCRAEVNFDNSEELHFPRQTRRSACYACYASALMPPVVAVTILVPDICYGVSPGSMTHLFLAMGCRSWRTFCDGMARYIRTRPLLSEIHNAGRLNSSSTQTNQFFNSFFLNLTHKRCNSN
jgi:hypothetical protein